ncbi:MAG: lysophospholipase [Schleiferiaceae bacterium]|nr:lysophospholipase [Schleiferiaceae bacterium]
MYGTICTLAYYHQEKLIFHPETLDTNFAFTFKESHKEVYLHTKDEEKIHGLLFEREENNKLVVYYHGNAGNLEHWGEIAPLYLDAGFNVLMYDYRGFGKSSGTIENEEHFLEDAQLVYDYGKSLYEEQDITIIGYSIGSGPAAAIASKNNPERLILKTPYYALEELAAGKMPLLPSGTLIKYKLQTHTYLENVEAPVHVFHGDIDQVIPVEHSRKLNAKFPEIDYREIENQPHGGMNYNDKYQAFIASLNGQLR